MEPLRQLLSGKFAVAGEEWERQQRKNTLDAASKGQCGFHVRDYRLAVAARGTDEAQCLEKIRTLLDQLVMWAVLPPTDRTVSLRGLVFRMLSRAGCSVQELLVAPHAQFPIKLFRLLHEPGLGPRFAETPDCMLDPWTLQMKRDYPTFSGEEFQVCLAFYGLLVWRDMSQVEARHATIRRSATLNSVQTHPVTLSDLSARWTFLQVRKRAQKRKRATAQAQPSGPKVPVGCKNPPPTPHVCECTTSGIGARFGQRGGVP